MLIVSVPLGNSEAYANHTPSLPSPISRICAVVAAMEKVESGGNTLAFNEYEQAAGILQIRPIMIREINRRCGTNYTNKDCFDANLATIIFIRLQLLTNPDLCPEKAARIWNGGYRGAEKVSTVKYWNKVKRVMYENV
jgi:hypothetical protein